MSILNDSDFAADACFICRSTEHTFAYHTQMTHPVFQQAFDHHNEESCCSCGSGWHRCIDHHEAEPNYDHIPLLVGETDNGYDHTGCDCLVLET